MKNKKKLLSACIASTVIVGASAMSLEVSHAAPPRVSQNEGAFVRLLGNPADGTAKFQYGWVSGSPASDAAGYWLGVYDITNSHYVWVFDTAATELPDHYFHNAQPTADLPNGDYKVVFFVRRTYVEPVTNIAAIEVPFTVSSAMDE